MGTYCGKPPTLAFHCRDRFGDEEKDWGGGSILLC